MTFLEDIEPSIKKLEELIGLSLKIFLTTAMVVIFMGVYIANLIYGDNSLHMLQNLQREKGMIQYEIGRLKQIGRAHV